MFTLMLFKFFFFLCKQISNFSSSKTQDVHEIDDFFFMCLDYLKNVLLALMSVVIFSHSLLTGNKRHFNLSSRPLWRYYFGSYHRGTWSLYFQTHCVVKLGHAMWLQWEFLLCVIAFEEVSWWFIWPKQFQCFHDSLDLNQAWDFCHPFIFNISCLSFSLCTVNCQRLNIATLSNFETGHILLWEYLWHVSVLQGKIPGLIILSCWHLGRALLLGHAQVN